MTERPVSLVRRILVAVDASHHSIAALEAAVELATRFQAELLGLYVEDINLLRLAQLPFAREVGTFSAGVRRLDVTEVERQIRVQTVRARRIFESRTGRTEVQWSFRVTRGSVTQEVVTAASDADLLVAQLAAGRPVSLRLRLTCRDAGEAESATVIGEVVGSELPQEIVLLGAHLDSWDLGTGALDDGAGVAVVTEAARRIARLAPRQAAFSFLVITAFCCRCGLF